jgi:hypothetical protein
MALLREDLEREGDYLLAGQAVLVLLLEHGLRGLVVGPNSGGLPHPPQLPDGSLMQSWKPWCLSHSHPAKIGTRPRRGEGLRTGCSHACLLGVAERLDELLDGDGLLAGDRGRWA